MSMKFYSPEKCKEVYELMRLEEGDSNEELFPFVDPNRRVHNLDKLEPDVFRIMNGIKKRTSSSGEEIFLQKRRFRCVYCGGNKFSKAGMRYVEPNYVLFIWKCGSRHKEFNGRKFGIMAYADLNKIYKDGIDECIMCQTPTTLKMLNVYEPCEKCGFVWKY